jgi:hypothetical protein
MTASLLLPLVVSALLALSARPFSGVVAPPTGVWALTAAAVLTTAVTLWTLALLVLSLADDLPGTRLYEGLPVDDRAGVVAALLLTVSTVRVGTMLRRRRAWLASLRPVFAATAGELVVVPDGRPQAFATGGRIVVTEAMLRSLTVPQRRVLLAHERAHLRARHGLALTCLELAVEVNPLLVPVRDAVTYLCERHADEHAVRAVGDRLLVAEALAAAALAAGPRASSDRRPAQLRPAFQRHAVARRIAAIAAPRRSRLRGVSVTALGLTVIIAACAAATLVAVDATVGLTSQVVGLLH